MDPQIKDKKKKRQTTRDKFLVIHLQWTLMMASWDDETNETSNSNDFSDLQYDSLKSEFCFE